MSDDVSRGIAAQRLLDDPLLAELFDEMRTDLIRDWEKTPDNAVERREAAWRGLQGIERLKLKLQSVADNGKIASHRAEQDSRATPGA